MMQQVATLLPDIAASGNSQQKGRSKQDSANGDLFAEQFSRQQVSNNLKDKAKSAVQEPATTQHVAKTSEQPTRAQADKTPSEKPQVDSQPPRPEKAERNKLAIQDEHKASDTGASHEPGELVRSEVVAEKPAKVSSEPSGHENDGPAVAGLENDDNADAQEKDWLPLIYQLLSGQVQDENQPLTEEGEAGLVQGTQLSEQAKQFLTDAGFDAEAIESMANEAGKLENLQQLLSGLNAGESGALRDLLKEVLGVNVAKLGSFESSKPAAEPIPTALRAALSMNAEQESADVLVQAQQSVLQDTPTEAELRAKMGEKTREDLFFTLPVKPQPDSAELKNTNSLANVTGLDTEVIDLDSDLSKLAKDIKVQLSSDEDKPLRNSVDLLIGKPVQTGQSEDIDGIAKLLQGETEKSVAASTKQAPGLQVAVSVAPDATNKAAAASDDLVKQLAALSEKDLDKVLGQLGSQLPKSQEQGTEQGFIGTLKAGVEEFKAQLAQGREPGLDLQAMVESALAKSESTDNSTKQVASIVQSLASHLESVSSQDKSVDPLNIKSSGIERSASTEVTNNVATAERTAAQTKLEQAINIAKPEAAHQLAEKVRVMNSMGNMRADIRLDPPDLGTMQIRIQMQGDQASVNFVVQSPQAKELLDQAVPRLRELLSDKGIELGQSFVQQESSQSGSERGERQSSRGDSAANETAQLEGTLSGPSLPRNNPKGAIDYFV
ncbi:flagellar hook-length control protein FliK [Aliiglaciecola sp. CAU 1673]|uniref:flagellar hook-length control protein FliK n=1 Tax=Aliiglaciecola sp. CAU 1673 TaxID=3032595 RepID=UPI0023DCCF7B|nr:flagellar hook-length control protein FliK [Aliiglaciecola sp. CAU 1673]MDF2178288.1 flagellar hook-length control protein FliK [Aliiglaciecola sp. CAU 1673]